MLKIRVIGILLFSILILLTVFSYRQALDGPFVLDDQVNIQENPAVIMKDLSAASLKRALLSNQSGELKRILPALSFGLNYYQAQGFTNTFIFKITNLAIHLLNSFLIFGLIYQLAPKLFPISEQTDPNAQKQRLLLLAFFVALLWTLHPLQVSSVAYIVQRMTSMATFFMLLGLNAYIFARERVERHPGLGLAGMVLALGLGTGLGLLCKENAALLILYTAVIELCLYPKHALAKKIMLGYAALFGIGAGIALYAAANGIYNPLAGYYARPFTLEQRLLTEARVLWFYLQMLVFPDIRVMSLYHDDLQFSQNWFEPITTVISVAMWGVVLSFGWLVKRRQPVWLFAMLWFLAGHSMESSVLPLEIIFEHRNYLPSLSIVLLMVYVINSVGQKIDRTKAKWLSYAMLSVCGSVLMSLTAARAGYWQSEESLFKSMAENHPQSPISLYSYAELLNKKKNRSAEAYAYYLKAVALNPDSASLIMQAKLSAPVSGNTDPLLDNQKLVSMLSKRLLAQWDISVLNDAARCVLIMNQRCAQHVHEVAQWLNAAIDNGYLDQEWRRDFVKSLFDIEMLFGMPEAALQTVTKAQAQDDRVFQYYLMKAEALHALGKNQESLTLLATAEQLAQHFNPRLLPGVYRLKNKILQRP